MLSRFPVAASRSRQPETSATPPHVPAIGALRGIAALYVVLFHMTYVPAKRLAISESLLPWVTAGYTGVPLFFVISAFTLCHTMRERVENHQILRFYARRVFRIVPLYYVVLVVSVLRQQLNAHPSHFVPNLALDATFLFNLVPGEEQGTVMAGWSIGVEMLFYALFPWLFRWVTNVRRAIVFVVIALAISAGFAWLVGRVVSPPLQDDFFRFSLARSLPCFAVGMLVYRLYERSLSADWARRQPWLGVALIALGTVAFACLVELRLNNSRPAFALHALAYGVLVAGLLLRTVKVVTNRVTEFYGEISYSVYLWHPLVIVALVPLYPAFYTRFPSTVAWLGCLTLTLGLLTPLALVSYRFIEQPTRLMGARLLKRW